MTYFLNKCMFRFYFKNLYIKLFLNGEKINTYTYNNCVFKSFVSYKNTWKSNSINRLNKN